MELTNILGKIKPDKEPQKPFLALELTDDLVQAAVWQVKESKTEVVSIGSPVEWDSTNPGKTLVQAVDATLSSSFEGLELEPDQVVFGLPQIWTNKEGIVPEKLKLIKLIAHELELEPLGFVVIVDSLIRYLKMQEGTPSTSLLIQVEHDNVSVYLVNLGKIESVQTVGRSQDISLDVEEAISRLATSGNLPSRIIVFDGLHNLEEIVQNLVSYDWQSKFQFLHLPKVENLPKDVIVRSIAIAGGAEVAKSIGFEIAESKPAPPPPPTQEPVTISLDSPELVSANELGFSNTPVAVQTPSPPKVEEQKSTHHSTKHKSRHFPKLPSIALPKLPKLSLKNMSGKLGLSIFLVVSIISIIGSVVWFVPHAKVTISITPKNLQELIPLNLSTTTSSVDTTTNTIPARILTTTVTGSDSVNTNGEKTVGDSASGEVTIYNRTDLVKLFPEGTVISSNGIDFTLEEDTTVASSSAGADYVDIPGKATVRIVADSIGVEGNLKEDSEFSVGNFSQSNYVARNESALSGGTSRTIKVVSQEDIDSLINALSLSLSESAKDQLLASQDSSAGLFLLEDSLEIIDESYSAKLSEETDVLEATIEVTISGISYQISDIESLVSSAIEQAIPSGYIRTDSLPSVELSAANLEDDTQVIADAKVGITLLPDLSSSSLQLALRGLSTSEVESTLSSIIGLDSAHVEITPKFIPPRLKSMPRNPNNIQITIQPTE